MADVRVTETRHACVHVRPIVRSLVENLLHVVGVELGTDAGQRRRQAALVAHLRLHRQEELVEFLLRTADLVAHVAGVAVERRHRHGDDLGRRLRRGRRRVDRRRQGLALGIAERVPRARPWPAVADRQPPSGRQLGQRRAVQSRRAACLANVQLVAARAAERGEQDLALLDQGRLDVDGVLVLGLRRLRSSCRSPLRGGDQFGEVVRAEAWRLDAHGQLGSTAGLEEADGDLVDALRQLRLALLGRRRMDAVVVDDLLVVDPEPRAVVAVSG